MVSTVSFIVYGHGSPVFRLTRFTEPHDSDIWIFRSLDWIGRSHSTPLCYKGSSYLVYYCYYYQVIITTYYYYLHD